MPVSDTIEDDGLAAAFSARVRRWTALQRSRGDGAAMRHGIDGIEDQVDQPFPDLARNAHDHREVMGQVGRHGDHQSPLLGHVVPASPRQFQHRPHRFIEIDRLEDQLLLALAVEFAQPADGGRDIVDGAAHDLQISPRAIVERRLAFQEQFRIDARPATARC